MSERPELQVPAYVRTPHELARVLVDIIRRESDPDAVDEVVDYLSAHLSHLTMLMERSLRDSGFGPAANALRQIIANRGAPVRDTYRAPRERTRRHR